MEWPDAASEALAGIPEVHRVYGWYVLLALAIGGVVGWMRRMANLDGGKPAAAMTQDEMARLVKGCINGDFQHHEDKMMAALGDQERRLNLKIDHLAEVSAAMHAKTGERLATLEERVRGRLAWDGDERRRHP